MDLLTIFMCKIGLPFLLDSSPFFFLKKCVIGGVFEQCASNPISSPKRCGFYCVILHIVVIFGNPYVVLQQSWSSLGALGFSVASWERKTVFILKRRDFTSLASNI